MDTTISNTIGTIRSIVSENRDLYFPVFDDPLFILNTENEEKRMMARSLAILMSIERDQDGKILIIGNGDISGIEENLSKTNDYLRSRGFDPDTISSNIQISDISDVIAFEEETKGKEYSLIILENAEKYEEEDDAHNPEMLEAIRNLHTYRALLTAKEDYDPGYEYPENRKPGQCERGKYTKCGGDAFFNPTYSDYKWVLNAVMDALGLKEDNIFRKSLMDDDMAIYITGNHLFLIEHNKDTGKLYDNLSDTYGEAFECYANDSDIADRKELFIEFLRTMQKLLLTQEGRYLLNNYSIYGIASITDGGRLCEIIDRISFSSEDKDRMITNYEKYAL